MFTMYQLSNNIRTIKQRLVELKL